MMDLRYILALLSGKLVAILLRLFKRGGTALPGLIAGAIDKGILRKATPRFRKGTILVTGTNGKTTIVNMIRTIVESSGYTSLHNSAGSNLQRGLVSAILRSTPLAGRPKADIDFGIFECDEAALTDVAPQFDRPILLFNNLFRDQLDHYGEVEAVRKSWISLLCKLNNHPTILLNADDPGVRSLGTALADRHSVIYFGLSKGYAPASAEVSTPSYVSDFVRCPVCGGELVYTARFFSHLGDYSCRTCGFARPTPPIRIENIRDNDLEILANAGRTYIKTQLQGLFNAYNVLSATAASLTAGLDLREVRQAVEVFFPVFGRQERLDFHGTTLLISLVKNPVGFTEVLRSLFQEERRCTAAFMLNDNAADGADTSWIWDVDLGSLKDRFINLIVGGTRLYDIALRLKYDGLADKVRVTFCSTLSSVLDHVARDGSPLTYVFVTYTALWELERALAKRGYRHH